MRGRRGYGGGLFGGPSYGAGRVRVIGCGPGCLVTSLLLSVGLTLLLNLLFHFLG